MLLALLPEPKRVHFELEHKGFEMFSRQRSILRLIEMEGGAVSRLRLVKLAFLLSREPGVPRAGIYDFVPYKRGPFSFTLYHEIGALVRDGWLAENEVEFRVRETTDLETAFLDRSFLAAIDGVSERYRNVGTPDLVDGVYAQHPWYTLNSASVHKRAAQRPTVPPAVYTVGYEGIMVDALLDLLLHDGIERLIDVRCNPIARRYGFHKSTLTRLCNDVGIEYVHFASLGIPSAWRASLSDQASYESLFDRYTSEILPEQGDAIDRVAAMVIEKPSALMCMEAAHQSCHRSRLGLEIARRTGLPVQELRRM
jgi:uncharacterized protein (DUF488 family)